MKNWSTAVHETQEIRHKKTVADFESERKKLLNVISEKDNQLNIALGIGGVKPVASKINAVSDFDSEATFVAVASDWHVEETVEGKTINNLNEFNLDIAEQRINRFWNSIIRMAKIQRHGAKIDRLVLILGGDLMTGYIHEELIENNALSPTQTVLWLQDQIASGVELLSKHFGEIVIPCAHGNHGRCHDSETELLTRNGWKKYNEIEVGDIAATYNMETGAAEWQPLDDVYVDLWDGYMFVGKTATMDFKVTPGHRMVVESLKTGKRHFEEMKDLKPVASDSFAWRGFPKTATGSKEDLNSVSDDMLRILAWIWTDGSIASQKGSTYYRIYQSKEDGIEEITKLLKSVDLLYTEYTRHRPPPVINGVQCLTSKAEHVFNISLQHSPELSLLLPSKGQLPDWMFNLSQRQVEIFLQTVFQADGSLCKSGFGQIYKDKTSLESLQALLMMNGISSRLRIDNRGNYVLSVRSNNRPYQINKWSDSIKQEYYNGVIWCGTVKNGALITRRNGIPFISGNTTRKPRHATGAANSYEWMLYKTMAKHLADKASWHVSDGYHLLLDLYGKTLRIHHGDGLQYQGGVGGLTIPVEKAISSWNKGVPADLDIFGHWHQSQQNPKWVCNGSLIGFNAYSIAIKAPYEPPSQTGFIFDKRYGRTVTFPIFVD